MRRLFFCVLIAVFPSIALAAAPVVVTDHARSTLVPETDGVAPGGAVTLAFSQTLEQGWHVYWQNPGDSGLPLEFDWTLPAGAEAGAIAYPTPHRIPIEPLVNFGHEGEPVFLVDIKAPSNAAAGSMLDLSLEATWLICAEICVPETGVFALSIPILESPAINASARPLFERARAEMPIPFAGKVAHVIRDGVLSIGADGAVDAKGAFFFPVEENRIEPSALQRFSARENGFTLLVDNVSADKVAGPIEGVLSIETAEGTRGYWVASEPYPGGTPSSAPASDSRQGPGALVGFLAAAFLGGAILNLMPCVFPILFIKAATLADSATTDPRKLRRHGLLYAIGVVASFALLGGVLLALRATGEGLGWGFHLQSPIVVALSAYVLFAAGLNLAGGFSVGESVQGVGSGLVATAGDDLSAFLTGVLAVVVAAPCVGPFLTAPIGAAAVLPAAAGMAIFVAMALGLAAPYVAVTLSPAIARALPRPGPWMERFRQALAFPVFAAAAYFLWVLSAQTGQRGLAFALAGLILLAFGLRLWEWRRSAVWARAAAALAVAASLAPVIALRPAEAARAGGAVDAIAYDAADVERRRAAGEPVFIDFTAAWCVTCQVNKLTVLSSPRIKEAFAASGVAFVTADWTNRDAAIAEALGRFGANGVPLYVFYPAGKDAVVLPQPLTERAILANLSPEAEGD
jgi:thiol:disulfide interchange protein DsbD